MAFQLFPQVSTFDSSLISSTFLPWRKGDMSLLMPRRDDRRLWRRNRSIAVIAASDSALYKMNLNEYMVTIERPLGIRFALSLDGNVFVHSMKRGGNAERSKIIMVGDTLKKASDASGGGFNDIKDLSDAEKIFKNFGALQSLVLERPFSPFPIQKLHLNPGYHILFNKGKVPFATWNVSVLASNLLSSAKQLNSGFAFFSPKFLNRQGRELLLSQDINDCFDYNGTNNAKDVCEIVGICSEENSENNQWVHGTFPLDEYVKALERAKGELYYDHSLGMQFSKRINSLNIMAPFVGISIMIHGNQFRLKDTNGYFSQITEQIYVGSCIQLERDVQKLSNLGITAVLNFQSGSERANWGINSRVINESCSKSNILMVNYPIREVDAVDLRKKLPFSVGLLLRLLRKNHRICVTCTTGFDRSPACVIAYLHWIQDTSLGAAHNFVAGLHSCRPDRPAIVWATWDLIAMVENEKNDRSPTHVVNFVWSSGCREGEEVYLIGDFTGNWKESIKAVHKGGSRYETEVRLRHGKYCYKFIVGGQWRHSTALPTKRDEHGNVNNVIQVGDVARIRSRPIELQIKDPTVVKVIERQLTEDERFMLAFAARRIAFAICPIKLTPK